MRRILILTIILPQLLVSGCVSYHALALEERPSWRPLPDHLSLARDDLAPAGLHRHRFDPSDGFDMTEIAMLALAGNPDLKLARDDAGIAAAQSYAAGLLPDPQINMSLDRPGAATSGLTDAYSVGLGFDLQSLLLRASGQAAAASEQRRVDLTLLWQEWQVIARARTLFSRAVTQERVLGWLQRHDDALNAQRQRMAKALGRGDITINTANLSLLAWQDNRRQIHDLERQLLQTRRDLNLLLGIAPEVGLQLVGEDSIRLPADKALALLLEQLPNRRPDLLALKAGYEAQDERYRQAVLAQFPPLNLTATLARDTSAVTTQGVAAALALPLLNGNRGQIRTARATRRRMHDEYENRLLAARAEVSRLLADNRLLSIRLTALERALPELDRAARDAGEQVGEGDLDSSGYVAIESGRIGKHIEAINLKQTLSENRITLQSLLGFDQAGPDNDHGAKP